MIRKIEAGTRRPSPQVLELLALHLELTPDERDWLISNARSNYTPNPDPTLTNTDLAPSASEPEPDQPHPEGDPAPE